MEPLRLLLSQQVNKAIPYVRRLGVELKLVEIGDWIELSRVYNGNPQLSANPLRGAILCGKPPILYWPVIPSGGIYPAEATLARAMIHQAHHILMGGDLAQQDELQGPILALDYLAGRMLRLASWNRWMQSLPIPRKLLDREFSEPPFWTDLNRLEKRSFMQQSLRAARQQGYIDKKHNIRFGLKIPILTNSGRE